MVRIERVLPATPFAPERVVSEARTTLDPAEAPKLLQTLQKLDVQRAAATDRSGERDTYLVESGERETALKLLEAKLGRTDDAADAGQAYSHEVLESYLRCRFMALDKHLTGKIDMMDFEKLLVLLKDKEQRDQEDVERQLMIIDVDGDGMISYGSRRGLFSLANSRGDAAAATWIFSLVNRRRAYIRSRPARAPQGTSSSSSGGSARSATTARPRWTSTGAAPRTTRPRPRPPTTRKDGYRTGLRRNGFVCLCRGRVESRRRRGRAAVSLDEDEITTDSTTVHGCPRQASL